MLIRRNLQALFRLNSNLLLIRRNCESDAMDFASVVKKLNEFSPLNLAQSWDNVGVLVEPPNMGLVSKLMLTNDLTMTVMDEAEEKGVDMILAYHPPIFKPLKSITTSHWKERIIGRCLSSGIAVYSPHTSYDCLKGGVNDWLISAFGGIVNPIVHRFSNSVMSHKVDVENLNDPELKQKLFGLLEDNLDSSKFRYVAGESLGCWSVLCCERILTDVISAILQCKSDVKFSIAKCEKVPEIGFGDGRHILLNKPLTIVEAVEIVKKHLKLPHVRLALKYGGTTRDMIKTVAVCAGSGASVLRAQKADLMLTGELSHHDVLEMTHGGSHVILVDHSNSERGFLSSVLSIQLAALLGASIEVLISERDADPLTVV